ncbi:MAG: hypothetical protein JWQ39_2977 [Glaciihabitans sp.]|jgi:hypothetical protein|nr:hypothetical protein [Glaciihabitans sp.]
MAKTVGAVGVGVGVTVGALAWALGVDEEVEALATGAE